MQIGLLFPKLS